MDWGPDDAAESGSLKFEVALLQIDGRRGCSFTFLKPVEELVTPASVVEPAAEKSVLLAENGRGERTPPERPFEVSDVASSESARFC
jgi:hypothetical protein